MTIDLCEFANLPLSGEGLIKLAEMYGLTWHKEEVEGELRLRLLKVIVNNDLIPA